MCFKGIKAVGLINLFSVLGAWRYIFPFWTLISTASGWILCWTLARMLRRSLQTTKMGETTRLTTLATFWLLTDTRNTLACLSLSTLGRTSTASHLKMKGRLQGAGRSQVLAKSTRRANPADPAAYLPCTYTINWTVWACGWKDFWKELCLVTTSAPGRKWTWSPLLNERRRGGKGHVVSTQMDVV